MDSGIRQARGKCERHMHFLSQNFISDNSKNSSSDVRCFEAGPNSLKYNFGRVDKEKMENRKQVNVKGLKRNRTCHANISL